MDFFKKASESMGGGGHGSDLLQQAQGFMGSHNSATPATAYQAAPAPGAAPATTASMQGDAAGQGSNYSELYGSAQTLYQGLQDKFTGKQSSIDDHQLARAAAGVLKAAEHSGFAKDSQYADYFNKAETYLQHYGQTPAGASTAAVAPPAAAPPAPGSTGAYRY